MHIPTYTYGKLPVQPWEYPSVVLFFILAFAIGLHLRRQHRHDPSWRFFIPGLFVKLGGGVFFGLIYTLYYSGGDTTSYFESALSFTNLLFESPLRFSEALAGGGTLEIKSLFDSSTGSPLGYMFFDPKARTVIKLLIPFVVLGGKSYFLTTMWLSLVTYSGLWRLYRVFVEHFPHLYKYLALGILFMPSVAFWGSGILKDSFTLAATCYFIVGTNNFVKSRGKNIWSVIVMMVSGWIVISIKPYILLILLPGTLVWYFYQRIRNIRNAYFRYIMVPFIYAIVLIGSFVLLTQLGSSLGRFAPNRALETAVIIQNDLKQEYYKGNSFDIGEFDASLNGIASKFFPAVSAGLFRPFIWESKNIVMVLSGLENLFILIITLIVLLTLKPGIIRKVIGEHPILLYSLLFTVLFAFMIGLTTSNFGALVRFKIPLIPLFMATLMVLYGHVDIERRNRKRFKPQT